MTRQTACDVVKPGAQMFGLARIDEKRDAVLCRVKQVLRYLLARQKANLCLAAIGP